MKLDGDGTGGGEGLQHRALVAQSPTEHDEVVGAFLAEGLDAGHAVLLAVDDTTRARLADQVVPRLVDDDFLPLEELYASPAWGMARLRREVDRRVAQQGHLRVVAAPRWWERPADEWEGWMSVEAAANVAFAETPVELLCAYDGTSAPPPVVEAVRHTHPEVLVDGHARRNPAYTDPALYCTRHRRKALPVLPEPVEEHAFSDSSLGGLRRVVAAWAGAAGLPPRRIPEVVLAVHEVASNSVRHGGGQGVLRLAGTPSGLIAEVRDAGVITAPFAGLVPPPRIGEGGYGLWLVHQLVERVQIRSGPEGSTVRLHVRRPGSG